VSAAAREAQQGGYAGLELYLARKLEPVDDTMGVVETIRGAQPVEYGIEDDYDEFELLAHGTKATDLLRVDDVTCILNDSDALSREALAAYANPDSHIIIGGLHWRQAVMEDLTVIAAKFHPAARTQGKLDFLMGNGSLIKTSRFVCEGVVPGIELFMMQKYREATNDRRSTSDCAFDVLEFYN